MLRLEFAPADLAAAPLRPLPDGRGGDQRPRAARPGPWPDSRRWRARARPRRDRRSTSFVAVVASPDRLHARLPDPGSAAPPGPTLADELAAVAATPPTGSPRSLARLARAAAPPDVDPADRGLPGR